MSDLEHARIKIRATELELERERVALKAAEQAASIEAKKLAAQRKHELMMKVLKSNEELSRSVWENS